MTQHTPGESSTMVWWPTPPDNMAEYNGKNLLHLAAVEVAVVLLLGVPPIARWTGVDLPFLATILAIHLACMVTLAALNRRAHRAVGLRHVLVPFALCYNVSLALAVIVHSGDAKTPWWFAYVMYASLTGSMQELQPARLIVALFAVAPLCAVPLLAAQGVDPGSALASAAIAGGMGMIGYYNPAASSLFWRQERARQQAELQAIRDRAALLEREALMRDLHDAVGSKLAIVALYSDLLAQGQLSSAETGDLCDTLQQAARQGLAELRAVLNALDPEAGTLQGLQSHLAQLARQAGAAGVTAGLDVRGDPDSVIPPRIALTAVRASQELVTNVLRHAHAQQLRIAAALRAGQLELSVADDGTGCDADAQAQGRGLAGLHSRAQALNGTLDIQTAPGQGMTVRLRLPLHPVGEWEAAA